MAQPDIPQPDPRPEWLQNMQVKDNPVRAVVIDNKPYRYTLVTKEARARQAPGLPYSVGFPNENELFISEDCPEADRPYILRHEVREKTTFANIPNETERCIKSLQAELSDVEADRPEDYRDYLTRRTEFFDALVEFYKDPQQKAAAPQGIDKSQEYLHKIIDNWKDTIPEGTFHADYTPEQAAAIQHAREIGTRLAEDFPQLATDYEVPTRSNLDLAHEYIPEIATQYPDVAAKAVGYAIRRLLPPEKLKELTKLHRQHLLAQQAGEPGSEERREHNLQASRARHEQGIPVDAAAMTRGRGITPWRIDEATLAVELSQDPAYKNGDKINWKAIAEVLNATFHEEGTRSGKNVYDVIRNHRQGIKRGI